MNEKRGQVTIFIIIALLIVVGVGIFIVVRQNISVTNIPVSIQPVYNSFVSCVQDKVLVGVDLLETQAGYISLPEYEAGSSYMPFSSQLDFLGNKIPYWYYVSGNNIAKEQVPTREIMEQQLSDFVEGKIHECDLAGTFTDFEIAFGEPNAEVKINENKISVSLNMGLGIAKGEDNVVIDEHKIEVDSSLGFLYDSAIELYKKESEEMFLEEYGIDVLRLYAPVDGVDLTCSPLVWNADEVFEDLGEAIEINTLALSTNLDSVNNDYFFVDLDIGADAEFLNFQSWPSSFEVLPSDSNILIADPVGNQAGLGIIGFCYVPYHFVYNVNYPVLLQVFEGDEFFQFPVAVVIKGNKPREALTDSTASSYEDEICSYKNTLMSVNIFDSNMNFVDASVSFECLGTNCDIGETVSGALTEMFPQCVNGYIVVEADDFEKEKYLISTVEEGSVSIILDKLYSLDVGVQLDGVKTGETAIIYLTSEKDSQTISYPTQNSIGLSEGEYNISVYVYSDSSIELNAMTTQQCTEVASSGIGGFLGLTETQCFDLEVPSQIISNALVGGGTGEVYISENSLKSSSKIIFDVDNFGVPSTIEDLQNNYYLFDESSVEVDFV